jgi:acetyl esterase/lipase
MRKWVLGAAILAAATASAFAVSPWPSVLVIRAVFDRGAAEASRKLEPQVPESVSTATHRYDPADPQGWLDIHRPASLPDGGPVVVWIHGGGFVSGQRSDITNYARILAAEGFAVVNMDYTIAPEATYPGPVRQVLAALAFLGREQERLGLPSRRFVLAGDSAGAQLAAQTAAVISNPDYARRVGVTPQTKPDEIVGALLHCGVYDIAGMGRGGGVLGWFVGSAGWAYSGKRNWRADAALKTMSLSSHLNADFPAAFISAGNADPLAPQSVALAQRLRQAGVATETLFFPPDYQPPLGHEYQFDLSTEAGRLALHTSAAWLRQLP